MNLLEHLEPKNEEIQVSLGLEELKKMFESEKDFHFKWTSENRFIISLNFSFGSNLVFDMNYENTKSDIIAHGEITELNDSKSRIILKTKDKYSLTLILLLPILMLIFELSLNLGIPLPFFLAFPVFYLLTINFVNNEDKRLINRFKYYLIKEINNALQHRL